MEQRSKNLLIESVAEFKLPTYEEIPNVGLFLEQVTSYISSCFKTFENINVTGSMISNYVKKGIIANPVKKQYYREQIAYLFFIVVAKTVLSLEDIQLLINIQKKTYTTEHAYEYFAREFENILLHVYGIKERINNISVDDSDEKIMLRNTIMTVVHKVYLDKCFSLIHEENK